MPNIHEPEFDEPRKHPGFSCRRARIGRQAGTRDLGASLWDIPPGEAAYPYHYHLAEEELIRLSTQRPDVVVYPDSGKLGAFERIPEGGGLYKLFRLEDAVDYWEGERPPGAPSE